MKVRVNFVTNSSSSSFLCLICNHVESGWDLSIEDSGMYECFKHGHTFCVEHSSINIDSFEFKKDVLQSKIEALLACNNDYCKREAERLQSITDEDIQNMNIKDINNDYEYEIPEKYCPICTFAYATDSDVISYISKKYILNKEDIVNEMSNKFKSYGEFLYYAK